MKEKWILGCIWLAVIVGVVVAGGVLGAYGYFLGPVSRQPNDWGSFGAVMAGVFTLLSSVATIGTLLFLYLQQMKSEQRQQKQDVESQRNQQKHDLVVEKQLAALTFEQYLNHRRVFIERLNEQSVFYNGEIIFPDPGRVYASIFESNSPSHCEYKVEVVEPGMAKAQDLTDCLAIYSSIIGLLEKTNDMEKMLVLVQKIFHLQGCLGIKYVGTQKDGDMLFMELNTGLNIYDIPRSLHRIERVFNSILFFTGNKDVESICNKGAGPYLRDGLYRLNNYHRAKGGVEVHYESEFLPLLHELYEISGYEFMLRDSILWATHANLSVVLSSYDEVKKLKEFDYADELTDKIMEDIKSASEKYKDNPEIKAYIDKADRCHWAAMESLGVLR